MLFFSLELFSTEFSGFLATACTPGVYTHSLVARNLSVHTLCCIPLTFSRVSHTRMAQVPEKVHCTWIISLHLAFSRLMSHPSLQFPHGHFETNPDYDLTDDSIHMILPYFPVFLIVQDLRHSASRSLASWPDRMQTQVHAKRSSRRPHAVEPNTALDCFRFHLQIQRCL